MDPVLAILAILLVMTAARVFAAIFLWRQP